MVVESFNFLIPKVIDGNNGSAHECHLKESKKIIFSELYKSNNNIDYQLFHFIYNFFFKSCKRVRERSERDSFGGDCCDDISQHEEDKKNLFNLQQKNSTIN